MHLDISLAQWVDDAERREAAIVTAEIESQRIAKETGQRCLKTASFDWEALFVSTPTSGALAPTLARQTQSRAAQRRRWEEQRRRRSGMSGLVHALRAAA